MVSILRVCPDLLNKYFKEVTFSFLPRAKSTWSNNIKLLNKVTALPLWRGLGGERGVSSRGGGRGEVAGAGREGNAHELQDGELLQPFFVG